MRFSPVNFFSLSGGEFGTTFLLDISPILHEECRERERERERERCVCVIITRPQRRTVAASPTRSKRYGNTKEGKKKRFKSPVNKQQPMSVSSFKNTK
jgi:hypothetical protein